MTTTGEGALQSPVRWAIAALNLVVGLLFIFRHPVKTNGGVADILQALPALFVAGFALRMSPSPVQWIWQAQVAFLLGAVLTIWSLICLGRCFSVLPACRGVVSRGPYRWVRHPVYLGELVMLFGCAMAGGHWQGYVLVGLAVVLVVVRSCAEERLLSADQAYQLYRDRTPDMLFPGLACLFASLFQRSEQTTGDQ